MSDRDSEPKQPTIEPAGLPNPNHVLIDNAPGVVGTQPEAKIEEPAPVGPPSKPIIYKGPTPWLRYGLILIIILIFVGVAFWFLKK